MMKSSAAVSYAPPAQAMMLEQVNVRRQSLCRMADEFEEEDLEEAKVATAEAVSSGNGASTFKIAAVTTVASDNKPQKVTICILSMVTMMSHFCVPTESQYAYLQCKTTNKSSFELLPSNEVNVFFDGSFVSTSSMPSVAPGESFQSFLGADSSVKITATPAFKQTAQGGYFSKTTTQTHKVVTKIKNNKTSSEVFVICSKQLPRPSDSSIKVAPVTPSARDLEQGTTLENNYARDKTGKMKPPMNYVKLHELKNNIVWKRIVKPQEETKFTLEYTVEWPKSREVRFST